MEMFSGKGTNRSRQQNRELLMGLYRSLRTAAVR